MIRKVKSAMPKIDNVAGYDIYIYNRADDGSGEYGNPHVHFIGEGKDYKMFLDGEFEGNVPPDPLKGKFKKHVKKKHDFFLHEYQMRNSKRKITGAGVRAVDVEAEVINGQYLVFVEFEDGVKTVTDVAPTFMAYGVFEPFRDKCAFEDNATVGSMGYSIEWLPADADMHIDSFRVADPEPSVDELAKKVW